jgi:hypothetical protein
MNKTLAWSRYVGRRSALCFTLCREGRRSISWWLNTVIKRLSNTRRKQSDALTEACDSAGALTEMARSGFTRFLFAISESCLA